MHLSSCNLSVLPVTSTAFRHVCNPEVLDRIGLQWLPRCFKRNSIPAPDRHNAKEKTRKDLKMTRNWFNIASGCFPKNSGIPRFSRPAQHTLRGRDCFANDTH
ncbi:hypothetical protein L596_004513 [Steinernema carpocapsae]|uniref:Uncharacterized protein n=1 Tax=Steinernema carpocapsae TaxID=34508 RepID=A0A4U8UZM2_STECR|nr:hypothetical protein L596_004513 [Steinernema carpocapsae]